jgi:hypothetical protein
MSLTILVFDPGITTGWAYLKDGKIAGGDFKLWSRVEDLIDRAQPDVIVAEDFRLYLWKARSLANDQLYTVRVLGVIEFIAQQRNLPFVLQMAVERKQVRLSRIKGLKSRHAYAALQHGILYAQRAGAGNAYSTFQARKRTTSSRRRRSVQPRTIRLHDASDVLDT